MKNHHGYNTVPIPASTRVLPLLPYHRNIPYCPEKENPFAARESVRPERVSCRISARRSCAIFF